jgi:hypothetical protein
MVAPSLVAPRSGSPRNSGTASSKFSVVSLKIEKFFACDEILDDPFFLSQPE